MIEVRIGEDVRVVERAFSDDVLGIDSKPPALTEIQHIIMVQVAMQNADIARFGQQHSRGFRGFRKNAAVLCHSGFEIAKPLYQRQEIWRRI